MKLLIIGHGRHGKDTVCDILSKEAYFRCASVSLVMSDVVFEEVREDLGYTCVQQCYEDRHNHRELWFDVIRKVTEQCPEYAGIEAFDLGYDVLNGVRSRVEFNAIKETGIYDHVIWVDASHRLGYAEDPTLELTVADADYVIDNNGTLEELKENVVSLYKRLEGL